MGIRVFLSAFNACQSMFKYFTPKIRTVQPPSAQMELRTVVLCNPDYPLRQFRDVDFAQLYAYCHNITLYVDSVRLTTAPLLHCSTAPLLLCSCGCGRFVVGAITYQRGCTRTTERCFGASSSHA